MLMSVKVIFWLIDAYKLILRIFKYSFLYKCELSKHWDASGLYVTQVK
jgi:hypothetical protein